ncbi:O-acetyl-ADP-ribose deacetylase macrod1 [Rhizophlyctis rosea]|nr:O-acetyl-ADP-ribose deacetylase macrod1 [Rhizophlyctis rosea]
MTYPVDGAIHAAAGPELKKECRRLDGCNTGDAKITGAHDLPARHIIHTVGPIGEDPQRLASCYRRSLDVLVENNLRTIAFCCISTGIYGYPNDAAAKVAIGTVRKWMELNPEKIDRVIFCIFLPIDDSLYKKYVPAFFPHVTKIKPTSDTPEPAPASASDEEPHAASADEAAIPDGEAKEGAASNDHVEEKGQPEAEKETGMDIDKGKNQVEAPKENAMDIDKKEESVQSGVDDKESSDGVREKEMNVDQVEGGGSVDSVKEVGEKKEVDAPADASAVKEASEADDGKSGAADGDKAGEESSKMGA